MCDLDYCTNLTGISGAAARATQVPAIMSAVTVGKDGNVAAKEVADAVAGVMCALNQLECRQNQSSKDASVNNFRATRQAEGLAKVAGLDADEFKVGAGKEERPQVAGWYMHRPMYLPDLVYLSSRTTDNSSW